MSWTLPGSSGGAVASRRTYGGALGSAATSSARSRSAVAVAARRRSHAGHRHGALHPGVGVAWDGADEGGAALGDGHRARRHRTGLCSDLGAIGKGQVVRDGPGVVEHHGVDAGLGHVDRGRVEAQVKCGDGDLTQRFARARGGTRRRIGGGRWRSTRLGRHHGIDEGQQQDAAHRGGEEDDATHDPFSARLRRALGVRPMHWATPGRLHHVPFGPSLGVPMAPAATDRRLG